MLLKPVQCLLEQTRKLLFSLFLSFLRVCFTDQIMSRCQNRLQVLLCFSFATRSTGEQGRHQVPAKDPWSSPSVTLKKRQQKREKTTPAPPKQRARNQDDNKDQKLHIERAQLTEGHWALINVPGLLAFGHQYPYFCLRWPTPGRH